MLSGFAGEQYKAMGDEFRIQRARLTTDLAKATVDPTAILALVAERLAVATTLWDLYQQFDEERRVTLLRTVFGFIVIGSDGIVGHTFKAPFDALPASGPSATGSTRSMSRNHS
jgi:hypothetical protein